MKKLTFLLCLFIPVIGFAQVETPPPPPEEEPMIYRIVEEMPEFPGGIDSLYRFLRQNLQYPADALEDTIQGTVYIQFVVKSTGMVEDAKVMRGVNESIDNEALRVIAIMPRWKPGKQRGKEVDVYYAIPIKFKL